MENVTYTCPCGIPDNSSACGTNYQIVRYGETGEVIFATCSHGFVVINEEKV